MESIMSWSKERVDEWLKGLDAPLQQYLFSDWELSGDDLLQLTSDDLQRLGVHKIGHQELILEAVEKLCSLTYGMNGENLSVLTKKLGVVSLSLQKGIQARWCVNTYDGQGTTKLPAGVLQLVVELIVSAKGLFSLLNRYQFFQLSGYTASRSIIDHCQELGKIVYKNNSVYEKEKDIIPICRQLVAVCDEILESSPSEILNNTVQLETVDLVPASPADHLGIHIASTGSSSHFVTGTVAESAADFCEKILAGDEVIQVNDQIVVGWSRDNLLKKLLENQSGVTLVLKKVPGSVRRKHRVSESSSLTATQKEKETGEEEEEEEEEGNPRHSIFERVAASVRSLSFRKAIHGPEVQQKPMGQEESELSSDRGLDGTLTVTSEHDQQGRLSPLLNAGSKLSLDPRMDRSPSPVGPVLPRILSPHGRASVSSCPEMVGNIDNKETKKTSTKGMSTALSRRRVSCRELGRPDCDGWLWKKRKDNSVFLAQKWQRLWFVLKGPSLYWYNSPQEEKAEGLVQIPTYSIESAGEHKRKYVFKMFHQRFQTFIFAAENLNDMSKWINCLITGIQKHRKFHTGILDSEAECYSETESEDEGSPSQRRIKKKMQFNTLPRPKKSKMPISTTPPEGSKAGVPQVDEMGVMMKGLKEGGVSLTGQDQPFTQDQFRRSFIRRNKNPIINEKVHTLRALHSTLKAKEAELLLINKILEDSDLTATKFHQWKERNEELCQEIKKMALLRGSPAAGSSTTGVPDNDGSVEPWDATVTAAAEAPVAAEMVAMETDNVSTILDTEGAAACRLSLSDGEQLVDAEQSNVLLKIDLGSPTVAGDQGDYPPMLELSLGSQQESTKRELSEMETLPGGDAAADNYFYI